MGGVVSATPRPLYPLKRPGTHCTGGWVDPRAGLDACEFSPLPGFDPRTVANRYTDYAIPVHNTLVDFTFLLNPDVCHCCLKA